MFSSSEYIFQHQQWAGKTIALGTFPPAEAEIKCLKAKELTRTWRLTKKPKPTREWVMAELERLQIRVVSGRLGRRTSCGEAQTQADGDGDADELKAPKKKMAKREKAVSTSTTSPKGSSTNQTANSLDQQRSDTSSDNSNKAFQSRDSDSITASLLSAAYLAREGDDNLLSGLAHNARNSSIHGTNLGNASRTNSDSVNLDLAFSLLNHRRSMRNSFALPHHSAATDGVTNRRRGSLGSVNIRDSIAPDFDSRRSIGVDGVTLTNFQDMIDRKELPNKSSIGSIATQDKILADLSRRRMSSIFQDLLGSREPAGDKMKRESLDLLTAVAQKTAGNETSNSNPDQSQVIGDDNRRSSIEAALEEVRKNSLKQQLNEHLQKQAAQKSHNSIASSPGVPMSHLMMRGDDQQWSNDFESVRRSSLANINAAIEEARKKRETHTTNRRNNLTNVDVAKEGTQIQVQEQSAETSSNCSSKSGQKFSIEAALDELRQNSIKTQLNENLQKHVTDKSNLFPQYSAPARNTNSFTNRNTSETVSDAATIITAAPSAYGENKRSSSTSAHISNNGRKVISNDLSGCQLSSGYSIDNDPSMHPSASNYSDSIRRGNENMPQTSEQSTTSLSLNLSPAQTYDMLKQHHKKLSHEMNETARMMRIFHRTSGLSFDPYLAAVNGSHETLLLNQQSALPNLYNEQNNYPQSTYGVEDNTFSSSTQLQLNHQHNTSNASNSVQFSTGIRNNSMNVPEVSVKVSAQEFGNSSNSKPFSTDFPSSTMTIPEVSLKHPSNNFNNTSILRQFATGIVNGNHPNNMIELSVKPASNDVESLLKKRRLQNDEPNN
uniref:Uncharacterized protein n=1 Tax=Corethron hystrix TaxID=216773 RepID=A0A7S1B5W0_9STRA|mmetsp:Transcript_12661/g.27969  ORF Transcript_12661/g.27969 Transcript_12661/m.27969 type:complete len:834 (+) Transcript_12661:229-2730(+)